MMDDSILDSLKYDENGVDQFNEILGEIIKSW